MTVLDPQVTLPLQIDVHLRLAHADDLPKLEWYGQYRHYRNLFRRTYSEQLAGRRLMLLADLNGFPIGHIFVHLKFRQNHAYFYSFRVMDVFQRRGIGSWLLNQAEQAVMERGIYQAMIAVAKDNLSARRLYERMGYQVYADDEGDWSYRDHRGRLREVHEPCWLLEKLLTSR
jgi:ribosomal protein S18 acetylase RimI-like enzyme